MSDQLVVHWDQLPKLMESLHDIDQQSVDLVRYFNDHVCDGSGFDYPACAMAPIGDQLPKVAGFFDDMRGTYHQRWTKLREGIYAAADDMAKTDDQVGNVMLAHMGDDMAPAYDLFGLDRPNLGPLEDVNDDLSKPKDGKAELSHDDRFDAAADAWDMARDTINWFVDLLHGHGVNLPKLDERSLREYVVYPLAANYEKIRANADACGKFSKGMNTWAANFRNVGGDLDAALEGQTAMAITVQLDMYSVVMQAVGGVVEAGSAVYLAIGTMSETIAVEVEKVLGIMGERLIKVASRLSSKLGGPVGLALFIADFAKNGMAAVTDIWNDVVECKKMIDGCFELVDEIKEWAETQSDRLNKFHQILDLVEQLPGVSAHGPVDYGNDAANKLKKTLDEITEGFPDGPTDAADKLKDALDDLDTEDTGSDDSSADDGDADDDHDGDVLMAPGPLDGTLDGAGQSSGGYYTA